MGIHFWTMEKYWMKIFFLVVLFSSTMGMAVVPGLEEDNPREYYRLAREIIDQFGRFRYNMKNQGIIVRNSDAGVLRYIHSLMNRDRRGEDGSTGLRHNDMYRSYGARIM